MCVFDGLTTSNAKAFFIVLDSFAAIYIGSPLTALFLSLILAAHFLSD